MKQIIYTIAVALCIFTACNKQDEALVQTENLNSLDQVKDANISNNVLTDDLSYSVSGEPLPASGEGQPGDTYVELAENAFVETKEEAISTFSIDADGASYANTRRYLTQDNIIPPVGAVRTEEMINYFHLDYPYDNTAHPIALNGEVSQCPWNTKHQLVRIGIKGKPLAANDLPATNFVFLIDVSGSMKSDDKLPLLIEGFKQFTDELTSKDRVAIVTYAGSSGVALQSTKGDQKVTIKNALDQLRSGGSTAGAEGIITAYQIAQQNFIEDGNNRIILGTDGDFNVGISNRDELVKLIEEKRDLGIYLTAIGVGRGNYNDAALEQIANNGNGTFEYVDNVKQIKKVFIYEKSKFFTVAKDVKVQVEFNKSYIKAYRLIGYENRILETEDFEDDTKDAGEIGADQNITALYEIVPHNGTNSKTDPTFNIDFRYKFPDSDISIPMSLDIYDKGNKFKESTDFMQFTASVAAFSLIVIDSKYKGDVTYSNILDWLQKTNLEDIHGFKQELQQLVKQAKDL